MNPNNRRPQQQQQQREKLENSGQERSRDIVVRDDKSIVKTSIDTVLNPEQTVQRYNKVATQTEQLHKSVEAYMERIEEELDEHNVTQGLLHTLIDDHPQSDEDNLEVADGLVDSLTNQDLQRYHNIQEMHSQIDEMQGQIETSLRDAEDLHGPARKMADKHGFELEMSISELKEKIGRTEEEEE